MYYLLLAGSLIAATIGYFLSTSCMEFSRYDIFSSIIGLIPAIIFTYFVPFLTREEKAAKGFLLIGNSDQIKSFKCGVGFGFIATLGTVFFNLFQVSLLKSLIFLVAGFFLVLVVTIIGLEHRDKEL